jgi:hypothetical protein
MPSAVRVSARLCVCMCEPSVFICAVFLLRARVQNSHNPRSGGARVMGGKNFTALASAGAAAATISIPLDRAPKN